MSKACGILELNKIENDRMARKVNNAYEIQKLKDTFIEGSLTESHRPEIEDLLATVPMNEAKKILKLMLTHLNKIGESEGGLTQNEIDILSSRPILDDQGTGSRSTKPSDHRGTGSQSTKPSDHEGPEAPKKKARSMTPKGIKRIGKNLKPVVTKKIKK
jgi:hypothetical protein